MNHQYLTWAQQALSIEAQSIAEISQNLGDDFVQAASAILNCTGRTIVMGMGKSGHVGRKIAATLASTGTPAFFVHPAQFTPEDFALSHPAGNLGRRLLLTVRDVMHQGDALPAVLQHTPLRDAILTMSEKGLGMVGIIDEQSSLHGVFTDGDLRRLFAQHERVGLFTIDEVMKSQPYTISPDKLASEALKLMQDKRINGLLVCEHGKLVGALNMYDLLKARVI
ncbi:CBS domain-containing protein [Kingella kingae]|uniref:CBS domain-containing protein n=1 Tax=Kingella kingae TaxID=504 RepID=UPI0004075EDF|nr:CBS domain-containing protein [Kingella kingae]